MKQILGVPQKVILSLEPRPTDIVAVHESRRGASVAERVWPTSAIAKLLK